MKIYLKRAVLFCLLLLLLLPAGQAKFNWVDTGQLTGYYDAPAPPPDLSWESLWNNTFQPALERYLEEHIGFRVWLIKARNQIVYDVLHETNDPNLFVGPNNSLFDSRTLFDYVGMGAHADSATIRRHIHRLRVVQDTLARRGKLLIFVASASKASFMPENMPAYFRRSGRYRPSNYEQYTAAMRAAGINLLDLSQALRSWKDTASYPLFPQSGGHWSDYGAALVGDTTMRYVERKYGRPMRDYRLKAGTVGIAPNDNDTDTEKALNLLYPLAPHIMKYPQVEYEPLKPGQYRPSALIIGDSFVFTVLYSFFAQSFDDKNSRYWHFNVVNRNIAWPSELPEGTDMSKLDYKAQYLARDIIMIMFTEYNMDNRLDYGFSDSAYKLLVPYTHADTLRIQALEDQLSRKPGLSDYWWAKETETGRSRQQLIHEAAVARYDSIR
ncbi:alginate O-acetyltransferase AlgX-related protein [Hymenobacter cellulosilyticus]|uniref:AlgX/AlgJ SGNH hydrolase-like domain-containing protein n=1 Tax=Hymenobacter cellulosilyticus TaxID=2932248 RepID=A0A8T9Q7G9_9BACT|nr:hypothetical protein [Hymenobacter cellulosilyticus]UOQ73527.1 hypothetical protein MUN79_06215 [Hymenobacter cellulosilyticus]